jgi:hypothetical protein
MMESEAKQSVMIILNIIGYIGMVAFIAPYFWVLIFGGEFTFSSDGIIPQLKQLFNIRW